ncbi:DUF6233 domain-containing protein [Streptomyces sp. NPDC055681]
MSTPPPTEGLSLAAVAPVVETRIPVEAVEIFNPGEPVLDPDSELGIGVGSQPIEVHVGGCYAAGKRRRTITREQVLADACIHCRPDTELRVLG